MKSVSVFPCTYQNLMPFPLFKGRKHCNFNLLRIEKDRIFVCNGQRPNETVEELSKWDKLESFPNTRVDSDNGNVRTNLK